MLNVAEYWKRPVLAGSRSAHGPSLSLLTYPRCVNLFLKSCDLNSDGLLCLAQGRLTTLCTLDISGNHGCVYATTHYWIALAAVTGADFMSSSD